MKLQLTIASFTICLLFSPMLRAQESPRIVSYDLTVQIDVPNRQVEVAVRLKLISRTVTQSRWYYGAMPVSTHYATAAGR